MFESSEVQIAAHVPIIASVMVDLLVQNPLYTEAYPLADSPGKCT